MISAFSAIFVGIRQIFNISCNFLHEKRCHLSNVGQCLKITAWWDLSFSLKNSFDCVCLIDNLSAENITTSCCYSSSSSAVKMMEFEECYATRCNVRVFGERLCVHATEQSSHRKWTFHNAWKIPVFYFYVLPTAFWDDNPNSFYYLNTRKNFNKNPIYYTIYFNIKCHLIRFLIWFQIWIAVITAFKPTN